MTDLFDIFFVQMLIYLMQFKTSLLNKSVKLYRILLTPTGLNNFVYHNFLFYFSWK